MVSFTYPSNLLLYHHFTNLLTTFLIKIQIYAYFIPLIVILISVLTNITLILNLRFLTNHKISLSELPGPNSVSFSEFITIHNQVGIFICPVPPGWSNLYHWFYGWYLECQYSV